MKRFVLVFLISLSGIGVSFAQTAKEYYSQGVKANKNGRHKEAISLYTKAIQLDPYYEAPCNGRGNVKLALGQFQAAIEDYNMALEINSNYFRAYNGRGNAKAKLGQYRNAIEDYDKAIEINPKYVSPYYGRGVAKRNLKQYQSAINDYNKALELDPNYGKAYSGRGVVRYNLGEYQAALDDYEKALQFFPENKTLKKNQALALKKLTAQSNISTVPSGDTPSKRPSNSPQTHIVSVGIASYENPLLTQLKAPVDQAYQVALLSQTSRFVDQAVPTLINSKATRNNILSTIRTQLCALDQVGPDDLVIFYYSGHGVAIGDQIGLCPYDYYDQSQLISDQEIIRLMKSSPARHKVCIIEACKSEALTMSMAAPLSSEDIQNFHASRQSISGGLIYITSTEVGKPSIEFPDKGGIFSHYFLKGIKGQADQNDDKQITSQELFNYVKTNVSRDTGGQQIPQINAEGLRLNVPIIQLK